MSSALKNYGCLELLVVSGPHIHWDLGQGGHVKGEHRWNIYSFIRLSTCIIIVCRATFITIFLSVPEDRLYQAVTKENKISVTIIFLTTTSCNTMQLVMSYV